MNSIKVILTMSVLYLLSACGGGGSSDPAPVATSMKLTVVLEGSAAGSVKGIMGTIDLPVGVVLNADATGKISNGITQAVNVPPGSLDGKYTAATTNTPARVTLGFITSGNLAAGDIFILNADLLPGVSPPAISGFVFRSKLNDADGNTVSGASLALR